MAMSELLSAEAIERGLVLQGVPKEAARREAARQLALREHGEPKLMSAEPLRGMAVYLDRGLPPDVVELRQGGVVVARVTNLAVPGSVLGHRFRDGDLLRLTLCIAPRTKKNGRKGGFGGIKQGPAYRRYRDAIVGAFPDLVKASLRLPLPERPYNIAVTYYVDRYGARADKCGLDQGLYDALENAGVITNDWFFRTDDGTRIVIGDASPRVELTITPLE